MDGDGLSGIFWIRFIFYCLFVCLAAFAHGEASIYAYVNPVVALLCGALLFDERITLYILVGGAVTLLGVWLVNKAFKAGLP